MLINNYITLYCFIEMLFVMSDIMSHLLTRTPNTRHSVLCIYIAFGRIVYVYCAVCAHM